MNSAPVAGGNVWSYYKADVDGFVRLAQHTKAALEIAHVVAKLENRIDAEGALSALLDEVSSRLDDLEL